MFQVSGTTGPITSKAQVNEYRLEGGATVRDKTNGMARAIFSAELTSRYQKSAYEIFINNKQLIAPSRTDHLICAGCASITFKLKDLFIKITEVEVDEKSKSVLYVDSRKCINGAGYVAYSYIPKELTLEEAYKKIQNLSEFSDFKPDIAVYNSHGVAVFGWENHQGYALYWSRPDEENVKKIQAQCSRYSDGGSSIAKSNDGAVNFCFSFGVGYSLNAEPATKIFLT